MSYYRPYWIEHKKTVPPESELRLHRACFSGALPERSGRLKSLNLVRLESAVYRAVDEGFTTFITGMRPGIELDGAKYILRLRENGSGERLRCLKLAAVITHRGMADRYADQFRDVYEDVLRRADFVKVISDQYREGLAEEHDRWIVARCSLVIAVGGNSSDGVPGIIRQAVGDGIRIIS